MRNSKLKKQMTNKKDAKRKHGVATYGPHTFMCDFGKIKTALKTHFVQEIVQDDVRMA